MTAVLLPAPYYGYYGAPMYSADQMHAYAAAQSAADNAALRSLALAFDALLVDLTCECVPSADKDEYRAAIRAALEQT